MPLPLIGWIIVGVLATGVVTASVVKFWDEIATWLNTVAADAVERALGYNARQTMFKATTVIDKAMDNLRNTTTLYSKKNMLSSTIDKTTIKSEVYLSNIDTDVLTQINKNGFVTQEFKYYN